jgi:hypothetical protein
MKWPYLVLMPKSDELARVVLHAWSSQPFNWTTTAHLSCIPPVHNNFPGGYSLLEILEDEEICTGEVCTFCENVEKKIRDE